MQVLKRDGRTEKVCFDKITARIRKLCYCLDPVVDPVKITQSVCLAVFDGVRTHDLDILCAENSACRVSEHPDFGVLAGRIVVSDLHKSTKKVFSEVISDLYHYVDSKTGKKAPLISDPVFAFIQENKKALDSAIVYDRDYLFDYFGFKTLMHSYLLKLNGQVAERPQQLLMRVSCGIHCGDLEAALKTYELTSQKYFTHATPTLFNSGTPMPQMSSCFLLPAVDDSISGIYETIGKCATISKHAGGIGVSIHNIRANGSYIRGTNGTSNGIIPMLRVFNNTARYVDQCFASDTLIYVENGLKPISEIKVGDLVLTHMGNYQKVLKVLDYDYKDQELYEVVTLDEKRIVVTGKHPLLCVRNQDLSKMDTIWPKLYHAMSELEWINVEELNKEKDVLCMGPKFITIKSISRIVDPPHASRILDLPKTTKAKLYDLEVEKDHSYVTEVSAAHNGGGKRKGSFAIYLEPWHADIFQFIDLKKNKGVEELRARDLFYALWVPDLFMKRVEENQEWTLMCPNECPGLFDSHGPEFEALYTKYESEKKGRKSVKARDLWNHILESQIETGVPYLLFKDACNLKSNQKNLGTIRSSNLCTEIIQYSSDKEIAVCNLASISLPQFVTEKGFDFQKLFEISKIVTFNLNKVIDVNFYPLPEAKKSNLRHRPIGMGTQGQHDVLCLLKFPYESKEAEQLNKDIYETIYFGALTASNELAEKEGPYETYEGSPVSKGILQYDMWSVTPSTRWNWALLKENIKKFGVRNSLLLAPMPTGTTSQILGNTEAFEIATSNIFVRRTLAGEFIVVNKHLLKDLLELKLWTPNLKNRLVAANGSVQGLAEVPQSIKDLYKTVWEIKMKVQVDRAADRGAFIDQSQSFNIHMRDVSFEKLTALHFYSWKKGLKTGMYYLRTESAAEAVKFTVIQESKDLKPKEEKEVKEAKEAKESKEVKEKVNLETGYIDLHQAKNHSKLMQMLQILNEKDESETSCESCGS